MREPLSEFLPTTQGQIRELLLHGTVSDAIDLALTAAHQVISNTGHPKAEVSTFLQGIAEVFPAGIPHAALAERMEAVVDRLDTRLKCLGCVS